MISRRRAPTSFFSALVYPLAGLVLARLAFGYDMLPLVFPLVSGFALIGPLAAVGLYEMSRRREQGVEAQLGRRVRRGSLAVLSGDRRPWDWWCWRFSCCGSAPPMAIYRLDARSRAAGLGRRLRA